MGVWLVGGWFDGLGEGRKGGGMCMCIYSCAT